MKIALVYDRINKYGGAERIIEALQEIWPQAPIYTAVYDPQGALWAKNYKIKTSFLQKIPILRAHHEFVPWATPMAFQTFDFSDFDVVISITSAEAKSIITRPHTLHICYCLTPTRYLWSGFFEYSQNPTLGMFSNLGRIGLKFMADKLKSWDLISSKRPDIYLAISDTVKNRIKKYYKRDVHGIIYPPVDTDAFDIKSDSSLKTVDLNNDYYLTVSRFVGYKHPDMVIKAFNKLKRNLVIIGQGRQEKYLKRIAGKNITFIESNLTDSQLCGYYNRCRAFVYAGDEDFGLVAAEAQSSGAAVIGLNQGGISEIVIDKKTGVLFNNQTESDLERAVLKFESLNINKHDCRKNALRFSKTNFQNLFLNKVTNLYGIYQKSNYLI